MILYFIAVIYLTILRQLCGLYFQALHATLLQTSLYIELFYISYLFLGLIFKVGETGSRDTNLCI